MRVDEIMTRTIHSCSPQDTLEGAAQIMWEHDCGCVPVCEGSGSRRVIGTITDRDICMSALFRGKPLREIAVSDAMAREVQSCRAEDSLAQAEKAMRNGQIRRVPVIDDQGSLIGMLSLADIAREAAREQTRPRREVTEVEVNETLAAICNPSRQSLNA